MRADPAQQTEAGFDEERCLHQPLGPKIMEVMEVAGVMALELVARRLVEGFQRAADVLEAVTEDEIVRAFEPSRRVQPHRRGPRQLNPATYRSGRGRPDRYAELTTGGLMPDTRTALVTGATAGLGEAVAVALAGRGMHVLVHGRNARRAAATVDRIAESGGDAQAVLADLGLAGTGP